MMEDTEKTIRMRKIQTKEDIKNIIISIELHC